MPPGAHLHSEKSRDDGVVPRDATELVREREGRHAERSAADGIWDDGRVRARALAEDVHSVSPPRKPRMWKGRPSTATGGTRTHSGKGVIDRGTDDTRVFASKVTTRLSEDRDPDPDAEAEAGCLAASPADGVFHP